MNVYLSKILFAEDLIQWEKVSNSWKSEGSEWSKLISHVSKSNTE